MAEKTKWGRRLLRNLAVLILLAVGLALATFEWETFGGEIAGERLKRAQAFSNYEDGAFFNDLRQSEATAGLYWDYLMEQVFGDQVRVPQEAVPVLPLLLSPEDQPPAPGLRAAWLGHSSVYLEMDGLRLLVDPVFSDRASPVSYFGPKRLHDAPIALEDLPKIDAVMISHDHYDHLDMKTIQALAADGSRIFVPLGIGAHLERWQVPSEQIVELAWWESVTVQGVKIVSTPSRHYSGRDLFDFKKTLWSSWSLIGPNHRTYYSGDTGYSDHFQTIGDKFGPFDLSLMKVGAYGPGESWTDIHMEPEEAVKAHLALRAQRLLPVHWATFNLAFHDWEEPIERTLTAAQAQQVELLTPRIGELVDMAQPAKPQTWWRP